MTSYISVNVDTRAVPAVRASEPPGWREPALTPGEAGDTSENLSSKTPVKAPPTRPALENLPPARRAAPVDSADTLTAHAQDRLSGVVMAAQGAVGSLETRQRTYQALERALKATLTDSGSAPSNAASAQPASAQPAAGQAASAQPASGQAGTSAAGPAGTGAAGTDAAAATPSAGTAAGSTSAAGAQASSDPQSAVVPARSASSAAVGEPAAQPASPGGIDLIQRLSAQGLRERAVLRDSLKAANDLGADVARRNDAVRQLVAEKSFGSNLAVAADQRDSLATTLGRLLGATATPNSDGSVSLSVGGVSVLDASGWRNLGLTTTSGPQGPRLGVSLADGTSVPVTSGVVGGVLEVVNEVLPRAMASVAAGAAGATGATGTTDDSRSALAAKVTGLQHQLGGSPYLRIQGLTTQPIWAGLVEGHLGAIGPVEPQARAGAMSALLGVNARVASLGVASEAATANVNTLVTISRPDLVSVATDTVPAPGSVNFTVLSAAAPATAISTSAFGSSEVLNDGAGFTFGVVEKANGVEKTTQISVRDFPTVEDVARAINGSGTGVRALTTTIAAGTVQLVVMSLTTGRTTEVTITDGQQPPSTSNILGRFHMMEGADSVIRVDRGSGVADLVTNSQSRVEGLLPGLALNVNRPDPAASVSVVVGQDVRGLSSRVDSLVSAAAGVLGAAFTATQASGALPGDRMLADVAGRVISAMGPSDGRSLPGLSVGRHGLRFDREVFEAAYRRDPAGVESAVASVAQGLSEVSKDASSPRTGYLAVRLIGEQQVLADYRAPRTGADERLSRQQDALTQQGGALTSLLQRLSSERGWLTDQLA